MDELDLVPEPYRSMIRTIDPDSLYYIQAIKGGGEPVRVVKFPANVSANDVYRAEVTWASNDRLELHKHDGRYLRTLLLELCRAEGHFAGFAVVNPRT